MAFSNAGFWWPNFELATGRADYRLLIASAVREALSFHNADVLIVVTNSTFTLHAKQLALTNSVLLNRKACVGRLPRATQAAAYLISQLKATCHRTRIDDLYMLAHTCLRATGPTRNG
jgi:hypothetical protein